jgi:hypothetical protein
MEVSGQPHAPGHFSPSVNASGTHSIEGWVGPRTGIDILGARKKNSCPCRDPANPARTIVTTPTIGLHPGHYTGYKQSNTTELAFTYPPVCPSIHPDGISWHNLPRHLAKYEPDDSLDPRQGQISSFHHYEPSTEAQAVSYPKGTVQSLHNGKVAGRCEGRPEVSKTWRFRPTIKQRHYYYYYYYIAVISCPSF